MFIDYQDTTPIYEQIVNRYKNQIDGQEAFDNVDVKKEVYFCSDDPSYINYNLSTQDYQTRKKMM